PCDVFAAARCLELVEAFDEYNNEPLGGHAFEQRDKHRLDGFGIRVNCKSGIDAESRRKLIDPAAQHAIDGWRLRARPGGMRKQECAGLSKPLEKLPEQCALTRSRLAGDADCPRCVGFRCGDSEPGQALHNFLSPHEITPAFLRKIL